jgi:3-dehydroquinate dehydratase-1/3-dehydroquinate dehydratase/shikimate dehydrogenase
MAVVKGKICVSISERDVDKALSSARAAAEKADVVEIRLDALAEPAIAPFIKNIDVPLLFTCRPEWEGGEFSGSEEERLALLGDAVSKGAAYIDIELRTEDSLRQELVTVARNNKVKTIISWHDFKTTASSQALHSIFKEQYRSGADIGKMVTTARSFQDVLRVLDLQNSAAEMSFPLCAFCMGRPGMISRIATLELGGFMSYAAPDDGPVSAPGQLSVSALRRIVEVFDENG